MPYLYSKVEDLNGIELVGSHQCVALVQIKAGAPVASAWREGDKDKPVVSRRFIRFRGKNKNGGYVNPINNADAYSVVE